MKYIFYDFPDDVCERIKSLIRKNSRGIFIVPEMDKYNNYIK